MAPGGSTTVPPKTPAQMQPPPPQKQPDLMQVLLQQSQLLKQMEQCLANLETTPTSTITTVATPAGTEATPATTTANNNPTSHQLTKDPCERIKTSEVPKFDGKKEVEAWIVRFRKYCRLIKLTLDADILIAMSIAMEDKAALWWEHAENKITTWEEARGILLRTYGDPRKQKDSANKLKKLPQGSMTIAEFFMEIESLNIYAQLNFETLPTFLEPGFNEDLRKRLEIMQSIQPVETYSEWKKRALEQGMYLEAGKRKTGERKQFRDTTSVKSGEEVDGKSRVVTKEEKDKRMAAGECIKCGKQGHIARNCRKGWTYRNDAVSEVLGDKRMSSGSNDIPRNPKRQLITQPDGSIRSINSYVEDSGKE